MKAMSSSIPEYLRQSVKVKEVVNGVEVNSFKVPPHKFFVNEELTYLTLPLNVDEKVLVNKINELKLGRKTIEKLYAIRLDVEPGSTVNLSCRTYLIMRLMGRRQRGGVMYFTQPIST